MSSRHCFGFQWLPSTVVFKDPRPYKMLPSVQFILFCAVGVVTTLIDFTIYNLLTRPSFGWRRIPANILSVTAAMIWSFLANWLIVFQPAGQDWLGRAG